MQRKASCFLFSLRFIRGRINLTWTKNGVTDLVHIWDKIKMHEKSKVHINNVFSYSMLGKSNILTQLNSAHRNAIVEHNEKVDKNRYVLNIIINCIRFCGALELALRGHDESNESENKGVCVFQFLIGNPYIKLRFRICLKDFSRTYEEIELKLCRDITWGLNCYAHFSQPDPTRSKVTKSVN